IVRRAMADRLIFGDPTVTLTSRKLGVAEKRKKKVLAGESAKAFFVEAVGLARFLEGEGPMTDGALALLFYTPVRSGSLVQANIPASHPHPDPGDFAKWTTPAKHIKGRHDDQVVPLADTAVAIVRELIHRAEVKRSPFLLPHLHRPKERHAAIRVLTQ